MYRFKLLSENATFPSRANKDDAGVDLSSASINPIIIPAKGKAMVPTNLSVEIPKGTYGRVAPRSGLTWKNSIDVGAGVVDHKFENEVKVILFNHGDEDFVVKRGDRIAQFILEKIDTTDPVQWKDGDQPEYKENTRGQQGFGSSGV